jgi:hypothetical protein
VNTVHSPDKNKENNEQRYKNSNKKKLLSIDAIHPFTTCYQIIRSLFSRFNVHGCTFASPRLGLASETERPQVR